MFSEMSSLETENKSLVDDNKTLQMELDNLDGKYQEIKINENSDSVTKFCSSLWDLSLFCSF